MKVSFNHKQEGGMSVTFDGKWNALSLLLEDGNLDRVKKHVELKKPARWSGNIACVQLVDQGQYEIYSELLSDAEKVVIPRKKLLLLIEEWQSYVKHKRDKVIYV
jgi:predicted  nucleic acid-binding Zn-ribbon protein